MSEAHQRKKDPAQVRRRLIEASIALASTKGAESITVEAVSRMAGVSKGGFQHHFPTRKDLIHAVFDEIWARFHQIWETCLEDEDKAAGRLSRAYLRTNEAIEIDDVRDLSRASLALSLSDEDFRRRWAERSSELLPADEAPTLEGQAKLLICRLAADGLWLADLLGTHDVTPELRAETLRQLDKLSRRK